MVNFPALVQFLIEPLLEHKPELRIDCESTTSRTWLRIAFDRQDKGRVFGKGGRTIQAIRQLVITAGKLSDHRASLEVYEPESSSSDSSNSNSYGTGRSSQPDFEQQPSQHSDQRYSDQSVQYEQGVQSDQRPKPEPSSDRKIEKPRKPIKLKANSEVT